MQSTFRPRPIGRAVLGSIALIGTVLVAAVVVVVGQPSSTAPPEGLRDNTPAVHALVNVHLVLAPGLVVIHRA